MSIKQNRFGADRDGFAELGTIQALFEDIPASEVGVASGAQTAFDGARIFITGMVANQCKLAGCVISKDPYGSGSVHSNECWFGIRRAFYADRNAKYGQSHRG